MQVIGAGLPRTGTTSLGAGLERLLDGPCYHMSTLQANVSADLPLWREAFRGDSAALGQVLDGYVAATDWPSSLFWADLAEQHREALVVLSHRGSAQRWWKSLSATIWETMAGESARDDPFLGRMRELAGLGSDWQCESSAIAMYERHNKAVIDSIDPDRLLLWQPEEGWAPLCAALGVHEPDQDFFCLNTTADFRRANRLADQPEA